MSLPVNGLCGNETTLPLTQINGDEQASTQLRSTDNMTKKVDSVHYYKSSSDNPPLDCLGAKPRHKSCLLEGGGRTTGRAQRAEISETDWPSLPTRQRSSSTPVYGRKQDWITVNRKVNNKPPKQLNLKLSENPRGKLKARILQIADEYPTVTNIVLHTGSNDVSKQQLEVLKRDFIGLLNTVNSLNAAVFISGPVPPVRGGDERFSRLFTLNKWLISACADHSVHFINNFNIFWERRHLFKANGFNFNKSGVKLFTSNLFYSILTVELFSSRRPLLTTVLSVRSGRAGEEEGSLSYLMNHFNVSSYLLEVFSLLNMWLYS
uniref:SGNH hydrolase-type esterase domain-containing protein n=1 Tax=Astatotilapia calliptera TaxID=8154 RepID=A0A3P8PJ56_ASTCA